MKDLKIDLDFLTKRPIGYNDIKMFKKSPRHYLSYLSAKKTLPLPYIVFGSIVECLLLTPDLFKQKFIIADLNQYNTNGREAIASYLKEGITPISNENYDKAKLACESVKSNPVSEKILSGIGQTQRELKWIDRETGLPLIAHLSGDSDDTIIEFKTSVHADPVSFTRDSYNFEFPLEAAMKMDGFFYIKGKSPKNYYYIICESSAPFGIAVYTPSEEYFEYGRGEFRSALNEFKLCFDSKEFNSGYEYRIHGGVHELTLPAWVMNKIQK